MSKSSIPKYGNPVKHSKNKHTKVYLSVVALIISIVLSGCSDTYANIDAEGALQRTLITCDDNGHDWIEATCTESKTCSRCGETEGEPLGHDWKDATCEEAKTCTRCGTTEGNPLGHVWEEATCTEPQTCSRCGETEGSPLEHDWKDATCTKSMTCSRCGETEGSPLDHDWQEATCTEPQTCSRCGVTDGEALGHDIPELSCTEVIICARCGEEFEALGHDWQEATCTEPQTCSRCGETEGKALGHDPGEAVKENEIETTCTQSGSWDEVVYCTICDEEISRKAKTEKAFGHTSEGVVKETRSKRTVRKRANMMK